jgi:hypothetical protein
MLNIYPDFWS